jgi:hypothetical protein
MAKENTKEPYILISLYENLYKDKYRKAPSINRFREKWGMQDVIDSVGFDRAKILIEYYFKTTKPGHPMQWFFFNFDKLDQVMRELDADRAARDKMREETKILVAEREVELEHRSSSN